MVKFRAINHILKKSCHFKRIIFSRRMHALRVLLKKIHENFNWLRLECMNLKATDVSISCTYIFPCLITQFSYWITYPALSWSLIILIWLLLMLWLVPPDYISNINNYYAICLTTACAPPAVGRFSFNAVSRGSYKFKRFCKNLIKWPFGFQKTNN